MRFHEIVTRAFTVTPMYSIPYSQATTKDPVGDDGYRNDCSGFVSKVLGLPGPGLDTTRLMDGSPLHQLVSWGECVPGDFWGRPAGGSSGHIAVIVGTPATNGVWVIVDHGSGMGPKRRTFVSPPSIYLPYRLNGIESGDGMKLGDRILAYGAEGDDVFDLQTRLVGKGFSVGPTGPDKQFGNNTKKGVTAFQVSVGIPATGVVNGETYYHLVVAPETSPVTKAKVTEISDLFSQGMDKLLTLRDTL